MSELSNPILDALGLPWMPRDEMDLKGRELFAAIQHYKKTRARLEPAGISLSLDEVRGHFVPVPRACVHIEDPSPYIAGRYTSRSVTELIVALGGTSAPFNGDSSRFTAQRAIKILQWALKNGVPLTVPDRSLAWADIPHMDRLQWFRWKELVFQFENLRTQLAALDPPIVLGEMKLSYPDIGYLVNDTHMVICLDLDLRSTLLHSSQVFRVMAYDLTAVHHHDVVVAESDGVWTKTKGEHSLFGLRLPGSIPEEERRNALSHLVQAFEDQCDSFVFPRIDFPASYLPTHFAERWVAQREGD